VDSLLIFNNTQKLLAGVLALVLVAGMTSPAFAGPGGPQCEMIIGQSTSADIGPNENLTIGKAIVCEVEPIGAQPVDESQCNQIGIFVAGLASTPIPFENRLDLLETIHNESLGTDEGHCEIIWEVSFVDSFPPVQITQELWLNQPKVAGELLPLDSTALMIAGLTSMSAWMIPTVLGLAGAGVYLVKFRKQ